MKAETKVGIFTVLGVILIIIISIVFGKFNLISADGKKIFFRIENASGLNSGTPIFFKGIKVGEVDSISMKDGQITAAIVIYDEYKIPDNVRFNIKQAGFVGQKYVELEINKDIPQKSVLMNNYEYDSNQQSASIDSVMAKMDALAGEMTKLLQTFNEVVSPIEQKSSLKETVLNIEKITTSVNDLITNNDRNIQAVLSNIKNLTDKFDKIIVDNEKDINTSIGNIAELTTSLKSLSTSINGLLAKNEANINTSLGNIKEISEKLNSTMDEIKVIAKDINSGKGTLGLLINDEQTKEDVKKVVRGVSSFFGDGDDDGLRLYTTVGGDFLFDGVSTYTGRGYANLSLYTDKKNLLQLQVGNTPIIDPNYPETMIEGNPMKYSKLAFSLQYSRIFNEIFAIRFGIFDNTLGFATDFYPLKNNDLLISLEAYDFNAYRNNFEFYTRALIRWHFYKGLFLQAGVEDVIGYRNRMYMIGAGFRLEPLRIAKNAREKKELEKAKAKSPVYNEYIDNKDRKKDGNKDKENKTKESTTKDKKKDTKKKDDFYDSLVY